jgi:hypothetical protein
MVNQKVIGRSYKFIGVKVSLTTGVFNLSDSAGHINNFNDARGPQSYT